MTIKTLELLELAHRLTGSQNIDDLLQTSQRILDWDAARLPQSIEINDKGVITGINPGRILINGKTVCKDIRDFAACAKISHPINGPVALVLHPYQEDYLRSVGEGSKRVIAIHSRQMGMTTLLALQALWLAVSQPDQTILLAGHRYAAALEIMERVKFIIENTDALLPGIKDYSKGTVGFDNGSRVIARTINGDSARGLSLSWILIDDAAYVSYKKLQEFWDAVSFQLDNGTGMIIQSVPGRSEGLFYRLWNKAQNMGFSAHKITWDLHPQRDEAWAQSTKEMVGERAWRAEYECEFVDPENAQVSNLSQV